MKYIGKGGWTGKHDTDGTEIEDGDILNIGNMRDNPKLMEINNDR